jgi:hypothetical protein
VGWAGGEGRGLHASEGSDAICSEDMALKDLDAMLAKVLVITFPRGGGGGGACD